MFHDLPTLWQHASSIEYGQNNSFFCFASYTFAFAPFTQAWSGGS